MADNSYNIMVSNPVTPFTMARSFKACSNGKIFIGKPDTDPTFPENQIPVYVENECGNTVQVPQPIVINTAGYPVYHGQVAKFVTTQNYSMAVYDGYMVQQFYWGDLSKFDASLVIYQLDQLRQDLTTIGRGKAADMIPLPQGGTLLSATASVYTPEMFMTGRTTSQAIQAAINQAVADGVKCVTGRGYYVLDAQIQIPNTVSSVGSSHSMIGFELNLNRVGIDASKWDKVPDKWWDATAAFTNTGTSSLENFKLNVNEFNGALQASFFVVQGSGMSTSHIHCGQMRDHILGYRCWGDNLKNQATMNKITGNGWSYGYLNVLVGYGNESQAVNTPQTECHNININWCASSRFGGVSLQKSCNYTHISGGTYDYNGSMTAWLTVTTTTTAIGILDFGTSMKSSDGSKTCYSLADLIDARGVYTVLVSEPAMTVGASSQWAVGDVITSVDGKFSGTITAIELPSKTTARYLDIVVSNRVAGFNSTKVDADYVGWYFANCFYSMVFWGPKAVYGSDNASFRGLGISGTSSQLDLYPSAVGANSSSFMAVTATEILIKRDIRLNSSSSRIVGGVGQAVVPSGNTNSTWMVSINDGSSAAGTNMYRLTVCDNAGGSGLYGEYLITKYNGVTTIAAKIVEKNIGVEASTANPGRIMVGQNTGATRTLLFNLLRII